MKYIKTFENYINKQIGEVSEENGWTIMEFGSSEELNSILDRFYKNKKWIGSDGDWEIYYYDSIQTNYDEDFWHTKMAIYIDSRHYIIKTKELLSEPIYTPRDPNLTKEQELQINIWIGTVKNPRSGLKTVGKYLGIDDNGDALVISPNTGNILKITKDGEVIIPEN